MKFIADRMLGRLARWLRLFGYDTLEIRKQENEDEKLLELAETEGRILVSRDMLLIRKAVKRGIRAYLIQSSEIMEQLREMQGEFGISIEPQMDRCTLCNSVIRKARTEDMEIIRAKDYVYPDRLGSGLEFWLCDKCGQVYWQGKHWENIMGRVEKLKK
ncbi:MAG: Mut7-C RNAse domain-containing protein [Candidatus Methanoperedens sp.]|nr:Mut7-C RNAse domain-containing protein [Candidatus Methanoperedens sp.]